MQAADCACGIDCRYPSTTSLAFSAASNPTSGHLAKIARERYGKREANCQQAHEELFKHLVKILPADVHFETDGHNHYRVLIKRYFPNATHRVYESNPGAVVG